MKVSTTGRYQRVPVFAVPAAPGRDQSKPAPSFVPETQRYISTGKQALLTPSSRNFLDGFFFSCYLCCDSDLVFS